MLKRIGLLVAGGIAGAAAGLLLAPRAGSETRASLARAVGAVCDDYEKGRYVSHAPAGGAEPAFAERDEETQMKVNEACARIARQNASADTHAAAGTNSGEASAIPESADTSADDAPEPASATREA